MRRTLPALLLLALAAPSWAAPVRIFAVGHKQRLDDAVTYAAFRDKMAAMMDAAHPARATRVQPGVDDVASHLAPVDPSAPAQALVVFPESTGLLASFIGTRGESARAQTSAPAAIISLFAPYQAQMDHYAAKFPGQPPVRNLVLALTDTLYRAVYETFRDLAVQHGVYLAVSADVAPARRVEDPALVALLRDPDEPGRSYAYEATSPRAANVTWVFAPDGSLLVPDGDGGTRHAPAETDGELRGSLDKAYLTPIEQPPPGEPAGLALAAGFVRDMEVLDTPVGRLAIVISKDAWMVDVNDRFVAKGANVVLQPEAFDSWAFSTAEWSPDVFKEGGFANVQKNPEWVVNVNASMTGNLLDITFDGQTAIIGRRQKSDPGPLSPANAWIGQNPDTAFLAIAPWIVPDPALADPSLTLAQRRTALAAQGMNLLPGSGVPCADPLVVGACENGYRESVVFADVDVPDGVRTGPVDPVRAAPPRFGGSVRVNGTETVPTAQSAPKVVAKGSRVVVVWHEAAAGAAPNVMLAVSKNRGATFGPAVRVSDNAPGSVWELHPSIAIRGRKIAVTWQELANGANDDDGRVKLAWFNVRGAKQGADVRVDDGAAGGKWMPVVALPGPRPVVAWIDERDLGPEGEPLEHVYAARAATGGRSFAPPVRVDAGDPVPLAAHQDNKWSPSIAADGRDVWIAWADFRNYNWDVFLAHSDDRGTTFGANVRVDDFPNVERVNERPTLAADRHGRLHVAWTDLRAREADTNVFYTRSDDGGTTFAPNRQLDDSRAGVDPNVDTPTNQWHPTLVADRGTLFVAWQDDRLGNDDVFFTTSSDGGDTFATSERVDDTGDGISAQTRPSLALQGRGKRRQCVVVFEDDRDGTQDVWLARRPCPN